MSISRRTFLRSSAVTAAATTAVVTGGIRLGVDDPAFAQDAPVGTDSVAVYLVVVDGLLPEEVAQMPSLRQLATDGFYLPESRAQMLAETTPNHVSMITGMRSDRHGMPGNAVAYLDENIGREPRYLQADTIYSLIARQVPDLVTAAATSKSYIVDMSKHERVDPGREDADATNSPFIVPGLDNAVDAEVGPNALQFSRELDPDFLWMSLGDVDRVGHLDQTGSAQDPTGLPPAVRTSDLQAADRQVGNLIAQLQLDGRWERTVVIFTTDHSMDWSMPDSTVNLFPSFEADPMLAGQIDVGQNGGAALYWLLAPDAPEAPERLRRMREIAIADEGVLEAHYTRPNPMDGGERHWVGGGGGGGGLGVDRRPGR
jgi:ectonucleotide pyrophosphatase/phosphodiesterase family member 5